MGKDSRYSQDSRYGLILGFSFFSVQQFTNLVTNLIISASPSWHDIIKLKLSQSVSERKVVKASRLLNNVFLSDA